jgi:hypothetical protein
MKITELVQLAKVASPDAFREVADQQSVAIVGAALAELARQIRAGGGPVGVAGFGRFVVRETAAPADGGVAQRRVMFRLAPESADKLAAAAKPAAGAKQPAPAAAKKQSAAAKQARAGAAKPRKAAKKQS